MIRTAGAAAWPFEACGALLGTSDGSGTRRVAHAIPLRNAEATRPRDRFVVAPGDYVAIEDEARRLGLSLLGFWHSHPDGEARPSRVDREHAWEGFLTVVVAVERGEPREVRAWELLGEDAPFSAVPLEANDAPAAPGSPSAPGAA